MIKDYLKKNWINILIIAVFIVCAFAMAQYHELWSDEAQSWLIARDLSVPEIIGYIRYEGTPPLWVLTIKLFMFLGVTYETYFIIPIIFMSLGLLFLYSKFDIPWYLKILFPFTYYVFFQTTIVVRSYSMILLGIAMMYYFFPQRYEKTWKFYFALLYFMSISLQSYFVAGSFYAMMLLFLLKDYKKLDEKTRKRMIIVSCLIFLTFLALLIMIFPNANVGFGGNGGKSLFYIIGESTLADSNKIIQYISTAIIIGFVIYIVINRFKEVEDKNEAIKEVEIICVSFPLIVTFLFIHAQVRYFAILYFMIVLYFIENKKYPLVKTLLTFIFITQIVWNVQSCVFDYHEKYGVGEEIANFLKEIEYENKVVDTINFHIVEVAPYFDKNVFYHSYHTEKAFYSWNLATPYSETEDLLKSNADIYLIPLLNDGLKGSEVTARYSINVADFIFAADYDKYTVYSFNACIPQKGQVNEHDTFFIYVNDRVKKEMEEKNIQLEQENRTFNFYDDNKEWVGTINFSEL